MKTLAITVLLLSLPSAASAYTMGPEQPGRCSFTDDSKKTYSGKCVVEQGDGDIMIWTADTGRSIVFKSKKRDNVWDIEGRTFTYQEDGCYGDSSGRNLYCFAQ